MSLPPEILKLKRKRNEEPVETLFIHKEYRDSKKTFTDTAFRFKRLNIECSHAASGKTKIAVRHRSSIDSHTPRVPIIRSTLPGEENQDSQVKLAQDHTAIKSNTMGNAPLFQNVSTRANSAPQIDISRLAARKFHLTKDSVSRSHQVLATNGSIRKRTRSQRGDVAVFSERTRDIYDAIVTSRIPDSTSSYRLSGPSNLSYSSQNDANNAIKRPNASAAEKQWRAQTWSRVKQDSNTTIAHANAARDADITASEREYETLKLAAELQKFAMEQTGEDVHVQQQFGPPRRPARFQPKPPRERHAWAEFVVPSAPEPVVVLDNPSSQEDGDEWITETYVRSVNPTIPSESDVAVAEVEKSYTSFGLLVITEEDQPAWEVFAGDESSESEDESDSSDSNAEDYYANDYPEDEVNSDDEFGQGAYDHRRAGSDDEEYDGNTATSSDEEKVKPWQRELWSNSNAAKDESSARQGWSHGGLGA